MKDFETAREATASAHPNFDVRRRMSGFPQPSADSWDREPSKSISLCPGTGGLR